VNGASLQEWALNNDYLLLHDAKEYPLSKVATRLLARLVLDLNDSRLPTACLLSGSW